MLRFHRVSVPNLVHIVLIIFLCVSVLPAVESKKRTERSDSSTGQKSKIDQYCRAMSWFDKRQQNLCIRHPDTIAKIRNGVENALTECRRQFRSYRWNCSPLTWTQVFFQDGILKKKSRETAFVQALSVAGAMSEIARACAKGDLKSCGCGTFVGAKKRSKNHTWMWGGCGDNIQHGASYIRNFMDPRRITNHARKSKSHNHEVARKVVKDNWERKCKCHGSSDSCTTKTCWRVVPTIEKIGEELWKLYKNAVRTRWDSKAKKLYDRAKSKKNKKVEVTRSQLAFFANSEDFCRQNLPMGIMGTVGRVCNSSSTGHDGCATMCCGRNYKTKLVLKKEKCNCRFVWCCNIKCDTCPRNVSVDTCL